MNKSYLSLSHAMEIQSLSIISLLFLLPLFIWLLHLLRQPPNPTTAKGGFRHYPLVGGLPGFLANRHRFLEWSTSVLSSSKANTAVFRRPGKVRIVVTAYPANVEHILKTNFANYAKGERFIYLLQDFLGHGIFNSDDDLWRHQRKTSSHEFNRRSLRNFVLNCARSELHTRLLPLLRRSAQSGRALDFQDVLERFTFDNVCKLAFNVDPFCLSMDCDSGRLEFMHAFQEATRLSFGRFMSALPVIWKIKRLFNIQPENRLRKSIQTVHRFADDIIRDRLHKGQDNTSNEDLLSRFIATDENSPEFLRDIVISFILAGRDTTSSALTWFFWLLSTHPDVVSKIRSEVDRVRAGSGKKPGESFGYDEIREMEYLHAALSEAMRLYPPVPVNTKVCRNDDVLPDGTEVKEGWFVTYDSFAMGRMEGIWGQDCKEFRPERWMVEEDGSGSGSGSGLYCKTESPFRYPIFNAGPRICLGRDLAYIQMKLIAACVLEEFDMVVEKEGKPGYVLALTLRMKGGLPARIKFREVV